LTSRATNPPPITSAFIKHFLLPPGKQKNSGAVNSNILIKIIKTFYSTSHGKALAHKTDMMELKT